MSATPTITVRGLADGWIEWRLVVDGRELAIDVVPEYMQALMRDAEREIERLPRWAHGVGNVLVRASKIPER